MASNIGTDGSLGVVEYWMVASMMQGYSLGLDLPGEKGEKIGEKRIGSVAKWREEREEIAPVYLHLVQLEVAWLLPFGRHHHFRWHPSSLSASYSDSPRRCHRSQHQLLSDAVAHHPRYPPRFL